MTASPSIPFLQLAGAQWPPRCTQRISKAQRRPHPSHDHGDVPAVTRAMSHVTTADVALSFPLALMRALMLPRPLARVPQQAANGSRVPSAVRTAQRGHGSALKRSTCIVQQPQRNLRCLGPLCRPVGMQRHSCIQHSDNRNECIAVWYPSMRNLRGRV